MMKFSGICLITENVPNLVHFYETIFNTSAKGDDTHAELNFYGINLAIFSKAGMEQLARGSMEGSGYGSFTISFEVDDVDAEFMHLETLGIDFVKQPTTHPWGSRSFWFRDPDRNIINFYTQLNKENPEK